MLQLFRKYQKYIFYVVTVVIIFSFVFFGTYQSFAPSGKKENPVVAKVGGQKIRRDLLDQMVLFLKTESPAFPNPQTILSDNYLNRGVISHLLLSSPLHKRVEDFDSWLRDAQEKERGFKPYVHPFAPALSAESCWQLFAPDMKEHLAAWKNGEATFENRLALFQAEQKFPAPLLAQMLRYQEREYANMGGDPKLAKGELSLFGHSNLEDWFGEEYLEKAALFVFEAAGIAKSKGYVVTKEEVQTEILSRTASLYEGYRSELEQYVGSPHAFYQAFMRYNSFDEKQLMSVMEAVMLFDKMVEDVSSAALVDTLALEEFYTYAHEYATVKVTQMPKELRFKDVDQWKQFELYLAAVAPQEGLGLPQQFDELSKIKERAPSLVGKRYELYVGQLSKRALEAKVSMRQTWEWEEANLPLLQERFPELKSADLDSFDRKKRAQVDVFAREQIVEQNPQWLDEAFADVEMESVELFVAEGTEFRGLKNFAFLDQEETVGYSEDGENYFRILVMGCGDEELLPLAKAPSLGDGTALIEKRREQIDSRLTLEEAMQRRFAAYLESDEQSLFAPVTHDMTVSRVEPSFIAMDDLVEGKSPLLFDKVEGAYFYEFVDKRVDRVVPQKKIVQAQQLLASELKEKYIATLLGD